MAKKAIRIYLNAPITLGFVSICAIALLLDKLTNSYSTSLLFSTYSSNLLNPLTYLRLIGHVFGHNDFEHFLSNMLYISLLGPILEEKYHDKLITVILFTALVTGLIHNIFEPNYALLGASGVVFAFILLASITGKENGIPITLILVAVMWLGSEIYQGIVSVDNISHISHILGGASGAILGLFYKHK